MKQTPIANLLGRLSTSAGWGSKVPDDMKARMINVLDTIATDDAIHPGVRVAAVSAVMKASQIEIQSVQALAQLHASVELANRLAELEAKLAPAEEPVLELPDLVEF